MEMASHSALRIPRSAFFSLSILIWRGDRSRLDGRILCTGRHLRWRHLYGLGWLHRRCRRRQLDLLTRWLRRGRLRLLLRDGPLGRRLWLRLDGLLLLLRGLHRRGRWLLAGRRLVRLGRG